MVPQQAEAVTALPWPLAQTKSNTFIISAYHQEYNEYWNNFQNQKKWGVYILCVSSDQDGASVSEKSSIQTKLHSTNTQVIWLLITGPLPMFSVFLPMILTFDMHTNHFKVQIYLGSFELIEEVKWCTYIWITMLSHHLFRFHLSLFRCQAIIWTKTGLYLIGSVWINFSEIEIIIQQFLKKGNEFVNVIWWAFCLGFSVLNQNITRNN